MVAQLVARVEHEDEWPVKTGRIWALKLTARTWKWMVARRSFPFGMASWRVWAVIVSRSLWSPDDDLVYTEEFLNFQYKIEAQSGVARTIPSVKLWWCWTWRSLSYTPPKKNNTWNLKIDGFVYNQCFFLNLRGLFFRYQPLVFGILELIAVILVSTKVSWAGDSSQFVQGSTFHGPSGLVFSTDKQMSFKFPGCIFRVETRISMDSKIGQFAGAFFWGKLWFRHEKVGCDTQWVSMETMPVCLVIALVFPSHLSCLLLNLQCRTMFTSKTAI